VAHADHISDDCLIWPFACCTPGYGIFSYQRKRYLAHRFMCEQKNGPPPSEDYQAAHSCGNRRCFNPMHLSWKTGTDNQLDRRTHGTHNKKRTKITLVQARQVRRLRGIETATETAAKYGITESNVRHIQNGKTWREEGRKLRLFGTTRS
jgi:HNH endonuclease